MSVERAAYLYRRKLDALVRKREQELQDQDQADYDAYIKQQEGWDKLNAALALYNSISKKRLEAPEIKLMDKYVYKGEALQKYETRKGGEFGPLNPLRMIPGGKDFEPKKYFEERGLKGFGEEIGKSIKKFTRPVQETEGYKQFQVDKEASEASLKESRGVEPVTEELAEERDLGRFIEEEKDVLIEDPAMGTVETGAPGEEFIESEYTAELEQWEKDLGVGEGVFTSQELENMPASAAMTLPTGAPGAREKPADLILDERILADPGKAPQLTNEEIAKRLGLQSADQISKEDIRSAKEMFPGLSQEEALSQYYSYGDIKGTASTGLDTIEDIAALEGGDTVPTVGALTVPSAKKVPDVEIPDAKPGLMEKGYGTAKKLGTMENIQNAYNLWDIGQTIGNKDATGEERGVATVQATKLLADLAAKQGGEATVSQIGSKAASDYFAKKGLQEGVKQTGKQAVGTAAGGIIGGYTMVTEGKEAVESWEEKDYDEAILHGIGSVSGGLQTAGAGMMLTGVGAPLGAVLYGVGTAGSIISSVGGFIEGLFDKDEPAPEQQKRPKVNLRRYYKGIMDRDPYSDYLGYRR